MQILLAIQAVKMRTDKPEGTETLTTNPMLLPRSLARKKLLQTSTPGKEPQLSRKTQESD